jgi:hypothetical protein
MPYQIFDALSAQPVPNVSWVVPVIAVGAPEASCAELSVPEASAQFGFMIVAPIEPVDVAVTPGIDGVVPVTHW